METEMSGDPSRQANQAAFRRLKPAIDRRYPPGHFVSVDEGGIIADAPDFQGVVDAVRKCGKDPENVLIVQSGREYPEKAVIFLRH